MRRIPRLMAVALLALGVAVASPAVGQPLRTIGQMDLFLRGVSATVEPLAPVVPKNTAAGVRVVVRAGAEELSAAEVAAFLGGPFEVEGDLAGPGLRAALSLPAASQAPSDDPLVLQLPPLSVSGEYSLTNLRLTVGGSPVLDVAPSAIPVKVIEQLLITSVTTRPLTLDELRDRGIVLDSDSYLGFEFTLGVALESDVVDVSFPVVFDERGAVVPQPLRPPPDPTRASIPSTVVPLLLQPADGGEVPTVNVPGQGQVPVRIPSVLVIPGNVGFLKQHFSAMLFVANGAPGGSGLVVREVEGTIRMPPGDDRVSGTGDDPLSLPDTVDGPQPETQPVRGVGLDGQPGTADDLDALSPTEQGQVEFVLRGEEEGFHEIAFDIAAVLDGLVTGPVEVSGKATGGVLVRNPFFDLSFTVPSVVRDGEPFSVFVTVTNISQSLANDVSLTLDASRLSGARQLGSLTQSVDTLRPRDAALLEFELLAERTGQVVADYLRFDTESGTTGDLRFTLAVSDRGVPLSPDTLVLPTAVDRLPSTVVAAAMRVLGQGWSLANAPGAVLPEGVLRTSRAVVTQKALALAEAGLRVELGQSTEGAVRDVITDFYGEPTDPGFDQLLRETEAGRDLDAAVGAALQGAVAGAGGLLRYEAELAALAASGPDLLSFAIDGAPVRVRLVDGQGRESAAGTSGPFGAAQVDGAGLLPIGAGSPARLGLVADPDLFPYTLELEALEAGGVDLAVSVPRFGSMLRGSLRSVPVAAGGRYRVRLERSASAFSLERDAGGDGAFEGSASLALETLTPRGPRFLSATVIGPETLDGAGPFGFHVALLFDRVVREASAAEVESYLIPDNRIVAARRQLSGRLVFASLAQPEGPYVPSRITAGGLRDLAGADRGPATVDLGSRLEDPGAVVSGTVREADGTPVAGASVVYAQNSNLRCIPPLGDVAGLAAVTTGVDGRYELRYVRQDACGMPFRLSSRDPASGAVREVSSSVRSAGEHITLDLTRIGKGAVEGTVRDLSGNPVAGAQVLVVSETDPQLSGNGRSGIDGRYRVEGVAVGTVRVTAVLDASLGRAAGRLDRAGSTAVVDVTLDGGTVEVSGRVLKVEGGTVEPVPALEVVFRAEDAGRFVPVASTVTSSTGAYRFQGMPTGPFRVTAALNTRDRGAVEGVAGAGDRLTGQDVLIEVPVGATVRGRVLLPDGSPAAGAVVTIDGRGVLSEADGSFAIPGVAILPLQPQEVEARSADGRRTGRASVVVDTALVEGVVVALSGLGSAELTVLDSAGQPLAGQQVALLGDCFNPCGCLAEDTGGDGKVRFDDLPLGSASFRATLVAPGFVDQVTTTLPITQEGTTVTGVLRFGGVGVVSGTVLGPDGEPSLGADVALTSKVFNPDACELVGGVSHRVRTDESGGFRFTGVNLGSVSVTATHPFFPTAVGAKGTLLAPGDEVSFELQLVDSIAGELSGTIFLPDGTTPAGAGVEVTADGPLPEVTVETGADGGFRFARILPEGTYTLTAQDPVTGGTVRERVFLQAGQDSVLDLRLKGKGTVRVRVVDVGGDPVESAFVRLDEGEHPRRRFEATLDASSLGVATFEGVFEGPVSVQVSDPLGRGGRASTVLPRPGDEVEVVVSLTVTGIVRGRFLAPDGATPIPFAAVTLSASGRVVGQGTTAGSGDVGSFRFEFVPAGPVRVEAEDPLTGRSGFAVGAIEREDQELVLDVVAQGLGTVTGLVTHNGVPEPGAVVDVVSGTYRVCALADADGRFRVEGVPEGRVVVTADLGGGFLSGSASGLLEGDGAVLTLDVALRASGDVTGQVLAFDGVTPGPLSVVTIQVGGVGGGTLSTTTDADGRFQVAQVPAGSATLTAEVVGGIDRGQVTAEVPEGGTVDVPIVLEGTGGIDGQTLDSDGNPVAGEVTLRGTGRFPYTLALTTGPDGRFLVPQLLAGPFTASLRVSGGGFTLHGTASGTVVPGETTPLVVQVEPSGTVTGLVLRPDGATPAAGAEVTLRLDGGRGSLGLQVDAEGRFVAEGVPLGQFTVSVSDPVTGGVALVRGLELTANGETVDLGAVVLDDTPVEVVSVAPADGAVEVPVDALVVVTFSDPLGSPAGVSVLHGGGVLPLEATLAADGLTVTLAGPLPDDAELTVVAGTEVTDVFGRHPVEAFTSRFRTVDLGPPSVVATVPQDGALEVDPAAAITVTFDEGLDPATDLGSLIVVTGPLGPVAGSAVLETATTVTFTPDVPLATDALYAVTVAGAVDLSGNVQEEPFVFAFATPDTVPPVLALEEPAPDAWVPTARPTVRISTVDALSGVAPDTATLALDGEALAHAFDAGEISATPEVDLAEGLHQVAATVADDVGNVGALEASFGVDTVPPSAATVQGVVGGQVLTGTVTLGAAADDATSGVAELRLFVDGASVATLVPPFEPVPVDTTSLAEGAHTLAAQAVDLAGNLGPVGDPVAVVVDNLPLVVEITAPAAGDAFQTSVLAAASVSEPVDRVELQVGSVTATDAEPPFEAELDLAAVAEGPATLTATAVGLGGETATATVEIVVDRTPPAPPDAARITAEDVQGGLVLLTGATGAVEADAALEATNLTTGASATGRAGPGGSFVMDVVGATDDVISLVAIDAAGNRSGATEVTVRDAGSIGGVPVDGLQMWVRADAGVVTDAGGAVETWTDQSEAGNDLVQAVAEARPVPAEDPTSGHPVLRFDGTDDVLSFTSRLTSIRTVFWVVSESPSAPDAFRFLLGDSSSTDFHGGFRELWHGSSASGFVRNGRTFINGSVVDGTQTPRPETLSVISLVTTGAVRADRFGRDRTTTDRYWWGDLAELLVYDRPLSDAERSGVEEYLRSKYLPEVSHVAPPLIEPNGGTFSDSVTVRLATTAPGAQIRYTTDGTAPDASSPPYEGPFVVSETTTVKAVVVRDGVVISNAAVATLVREDELPLSREGLSLWLRADSGVVLDAADQVLRWADQSGLANDAVLGDPDDAPVRVPEAVQGRPVLRFDGMDDVLGFTSRLTSIRTVFWVLRESPSATDSFRPLLGDSSFADFHGGFQDLWHLSATSGFIRNGETFLDGTLVDGTQTPRPEAPSVISLVTTGAVRANNFGRDRTTTDRNWWGDLAELIVYDRPLADAERRAVEGYLRLKYLPAVDKVAPPSIEPNGGTFSDSATVTLTAPLAGAEIRYTTDGTAPDAASPLYEAPFVVAETTTVKAVVFRGGVPISTAAVATLVREDELPLSREGLSLWLRADAGVVLDAADHVREWADQSGHGNDAALGDPDQAPVRVPEAVRGQPVVRFDGLDDVLSFTSRLTSIRTVFWVLWESPSATDSFRPLLGDSSFADFHGGFQELWHLSATSGFIRNGETFVDGTLVDGTQTPRPEAPSVISLVTTGAVRANNFGRDRTTTDRNWWGDLAELIVYDRPLADAERRAVEGYLRLKYLPSVERVAPPLIEPNGGTFSGSATVTLTAPLAGAEIRYTTDGTPPDAASPLYEDPFVVAETTTVKAVVFRGGVPISTAAMATFVRDDEVPLSSDGLSLWLRTDAGVVLDKEDHLRLWADQSGQGNHLVPDDPDEAPIRVPEASHGQPVLRFDGRDDLLHFASRLTSIRTVFWVLRESPSAPDGFRILLGDSSSTDFHAGFRELWHSTAASGFVRDGQTFLNGRPVDGTVTPRPETLSVISLVTTGAVRADRFGRDRTAKDRSWWGDLAELIVYDRPLEDAEREAVETYLTRKYRPPQVAPPAIDPNGGTFVASTTVELSTGAPGAVIRYTTDGTEPTAASTVYTGPFSITETTVVKAAVFSSDDPVVPLSATATATLIEDLDATPDDLPDLALWLRADAGLTVDAANRVTAWRDQSANGNHSAPVVQSQAPELVPEAVHGLPAIRFDGTDDAVLFTTPLSTVRTVFWVVRDGSFEEGRRPLLGRDPIADALPTDFSGGLSTLWDPDLTSPAILGGETFVGGAPVDGLSTPRPRATSVLSLITTADVTAENFSHDRGLSGRYWTGELAELIVYERALTEAERTAVEQYLSVRYGLGSP